MKKNTMTEDAPNVLDSKEEQIKIEMLIKKSKEYDIQQDLWKMLSEEPFYASVSRCVNKLRSYDIPTAGVRVNPSTGAIELIYNPIFMQNLSQEHRKGILLHELMHIVEEHIFDEHSAKHNHACDLQINSYIHERLPDWTLLPGRDLYKSLPLYKASLWYYGMIEMPECPTCGGSGEVPNEDQNNGNRQNNSDNGDQEQKGASDGEGQEKENNGHSHGGSKPCPTCSGGQIGDHSGWDPNMDSTSKELARAVLREQLQESVNQAHIDGWGSMPEEMQKQLQSRLKGSLDWKGILRYFVKASTRMSRKTNIRRINKRYPYIHPGYTSNRIAKIGVFFDQSGSVSDQMVEKFFAELIGLSKFASFTVIPFDDGLDLQNQIKWQKNSKVPLKRTRCGGTNFQKPTDYVNSRENNFDACIMLTDMEAPKPSPAKIPRIWITDEEHGEKPYMIPDRPDRLIAIPASRT